MDRKYHNEFSWELLRERAVEVAKAEPFLGNLLEALIIGQPDFGHALGALMANQCLFIHEDASLGAVIGEALDGDNDIVEYAVCDLMAVVDKDPATDDFLSPFLFYKGYLSLELYRVSHWLWKAGRPYMACYIQGRTSQLFGVDIHPAAVIGRGIFIDHATGLVVGETAVIEDNVSILHGVTLGGTGKESGKRHPTIGRHCLLGAGATVLGNITVGEGSVIGAGSVVLHSVPPHSLAAGVPAVNKGNISISEPSNFMDQIFDDYVI
ncbi:MAG: serine O-acetyltransferase [Tannerellaceae bacterium]|jgi:serine O-acetyltransferase|nr:serine O-acetyltransferase [Tannerellaceae bacterium]